MEAEYGYSAVNMRAEGSLQSSRFVRWDGDWDQFKWFFKASARLNGVAEAVKFGEMTAQGHSWVLQQVGTLKHEDKFTPQEEQKELARLEPEQNALLEKALGQSAKLAALLTLAIGTAYGPQRSIVMEELRTDENGIAAWAKLIQHFERSTKDLKLVELLQNWESEQLQIGEHPDELFTRLSGINAKLEINVKRGDRYLEVSLCKSTS